LRDPLLPSSQKRNEKATVRLEDVEQEKFADRIGFAGADKRRLHLKICYARSEALSLKRRVAIAPDTREYPTR
jgi:hypothetical protein